MERELREVKAAFAFILLVIGFHTTVGFVVFLAELGLACGAPFALRVSGN